MLTDHTAVAIAETAFYVPALPLAIYILRRNWTNGRPRMAWFPLVGFSAIRVAGGIVVILLRSDPSSLGLVITALVLLNVGVIPLIVSTLGLIRTIIADGSLSLPRLDRIIKAIRIGIFAAIILLATGGGLAGNQTTVNTGHSLTKIGYIIFAAILVVMTGILIRLTRATSHLVSRGVYTYLLGSEIALPFLAIRTVYGLISAFNSNNITSTWNPLFGSAILFALMALLPEYITLLIYFYLGFYRLRNARPSLEGEELSGSKQPAVFTDNSTI